VALNRRLPPSERLRSNCGTPSPGCRCLFSILAGIGPKHGYTDETSDDEDFLTGLATPNGKKTPVKHRGLSSAKAKGSQRPKALVGNALGGTLSIVAGEIDVCSS